MGRWCDSLEEDKADLLQRYCEETLDQEERNAVNTDLNYCMECVEDYHKVRDGRRDLWERLYKLEISRLLGRFSLASMEEDLSVIENGQEFKVTKSDADYANILRDPLSEILKYPYLMSHPELSEMCIEALDRMQRTNSFGGLGKYPGIYLLLVHPNEKARRWAITVAKSLGTVDRDDFYDLQEVFESIFLVVELGMSQSMINEDMAYNPADKMTTLPPHLYDRNEKNLWLGICMLLTQLDAQAMDSLFLGPGKTSVLQCIQSRLCSEDTNDSTCDPFWPALHCFMVILDRLGSRIWGGGISPRNAFMAITENLSYISEIENLRRETSVTQLKKEPVDDDDDGDDMVTCSQMVYTSNVQEKRSRTARRGCHGAAEGMVYEEMSSLVNFLQSELGQAMRVHNSTFLWFISFVNSLMDLDDTTSSHDLIIYLCYNVDKDLHDRRAYDRVTECFTLILIYILKLHLASRRTGQLYFSWHSWAKVLVTCATLPDHAFRRLEPPASHTVSSSTSSFSSRGTPGPHWTTVPREAMSLVRSLLKEGNKRRPSGRCSHFLDLWNKHFRKNMENRDGEMREWSLSRSELQELNAVLSDVAKLMMDIPASGSNAAPSSPLSDPQDVSGGTPSPLLRHSKSETAGTSGLTGTPPEVIFPIKQEGMTPSTRQLVLKKERDVTSAKDDPKPSIHLASLKPDIEKMKAIKSKLGNLVSRGKSDTNRRAEGSPLDECGVGRETGSPGGESTDSAHQDDIPLSDLKKQLKTKVPESGQIQIKNGEVIVISDSDESDTTDIDEEADTGMPERPVALSNVNSENPSVTSIDDGALSRDYDGAVSESQVFEFETQDYVASAWCGPAQREEEVVPSSKSTGDDQSPVRLTSDDLGSQTQAVSNEDIERACQRAEEEPRKREACSSSSSSGGDGLKRAPSLQKRDLLVEPRPLSTKCRSKTSLLKAKERIKETEPECTLPRFSPPLLAGNEWNVSKSMLERKPQSDRAAASKTQSDRAAASKTQSDRAAASKTQSDRDAASKTQSDRAAASTTQSDRAAASKTQSDRAADFKTQSDRAAASTTLSKGAEKEARPSSSSLLRAYLPRSTPAVVPPKKVRKTPEPSSTAVRLGLKKKERKAFDLSQRSLDSVDELRRYGQTVHVEKEQARVRRNKKKPKKVSSVAMGGMGKLLASQELQFLRQRKEKQLAVRVGTSAQAKRPRVLSDDEEEDEEREGEKEEDDDDDDDDPLPLSQPDPERVVSGSIHEKTSGNKPESFEKESTASSNLFADGDNGGGVTSAPSGGQSAEYHQVDEEDEDDWMQHTQHSVTEMEMCSQMEEASYSLTQRDPVDMDLSDSQQPSEDGEPPERAAPCIKPSPSPTGPQGDHLFLKPVPPASFKRAKAPTTKVYATASSRSASLMQEMEKTPRAPVSVVGPVGRGWAARPAAGPVRNPGTAPHAGPPPAATRPPPSSSILMPPPPAPLLPQPAAPPTYSAVKQYNFLVPGGRQPANDALRPSGTKSVSFQPGTKEPAPPAAPTPAAIQPPTYKTYSRPEAPMVKQAPAARPKPAGQDAHVKLDQSDLIRDVLKWDYSTLDKLSSFSPPKELSKMPQERVGISIRSFEQYHQTFYPLLMLNAFEELASNWQKNTDANKLTLRVIEHKYTNGTWSVTFTTNITARDQQYQLYPKEEDVVILWLPQNTGAYSWTNRTYSEPTACFGFVRKSILANRDELILSLTIETCGNVTSINNQTVRCEPVGSLISTLREFRALCTLRNSPMGRALLDNDISFFTPSEQGLRAAATTAGFNVDQQKAIRAAVSSVKTLQRVPKICLIHGPPGTGKSHTILGILKTLFSEGTQSRSPTVLNRQVVHRPLRVLLCAPSNAAIDNLMKTVVLAFKKIRSSSAPLGNCGDLNLVRLGSEKSITDKMKDFSLDRQTQRKTQKAPQLEQDLLARMTQLDRDIETISTLCVNMTSGTPQHEELKQEKMRQLNTRQKLSQELKDTRGKKQVIQTKILQQSHMVFCTLSTSGGNHLTRNLGHQPFSCVIVDEAGQAKETETIIPLVFQCNSLVLVGDPEQLPPTVISQRAKELNFGQSLMARLCKVVEQSCRLQGSPSPVVFLRVQYRMHPDICMFPSKHVYHNLLQTDPDTAEKRCAISWPFQSYRLFDVTDGREVKEGESYCNEKEVKLLMALLKMIKERERTEGREVKEGMVGVITPYRAQRERIKEELARIDSRQKIVVDTVDGFQGREMECVVVSCVRASHEGGIGFLGDRERLNVTITRAKSSLFILGHLKTLRTDKEWAALIEDAGKRGTIIRTEEKHFQSDAREIFKPDGLSRSLSYPGPHAFFFSSSSSSSVAPPRPMPAVGGVSGPRAQHSSTHVKPRRSTIPPSTSSRGSSVAPRPSSSSAFQADERPTDPRLEARAGMQRELPSTSRVDSLRGGEERRRHSPTRDRPSMSRLGGGGHSRDQHRPSPPPPQRHTQTREGHAHHPRKRGLDTDASPFHPPKRYNR